MNTCKHSFHKRDNGTFICTHCNQVLDPEHYTGAESQVAQEKPRLEEPHCVDTQETHFLSNAQNIQEEHKAKGRWDRE